MKGAGLLTAIISQFIPGQLSQRPSLILPRGLKPPEPACVTASGFQQGRCAGSSALLPMSACLCATFTPQRYLSWLGDGKYPAVATQSNTNAAPLWCQRQPQLLNPEQPVHSGPSAGASEHKDPSRILHSNPDLGHSS